MEKRKSFFWRIWIRSQHRELLNRKRKGPGGACSQDEGEACPPPPGPASSWGKCISTQPRGAGRLPLLPPSPRPQCCRTRIPSWWIGNKELMEPASGLRKVKNRTSLPPSADWGPVSVDSGAAKRTHVQMSSWLPVGLIAQITVTPQLSKAHTQFHQEEEFSIWITWMRKMGWYIVGAY